MDADCGRTATTSRHPDSQRTAVLVYARPEFAYALAAFPETVRSGKPAFAKRYGSLCDLLRDDPELSRLFNDYMDTRTRPVARALAAEFDFGSSRTVVDVGGGKGHITAAALLAHPHLLGVVLELPHMRVDALRDASGRDKARPLRPTSVCVSALDSTRLKSSCSLPAYMVAYLQKSLNRSGDNSV